MKFKIGDKVRIKDDLNQEKAYRVDVVGSMIEFAGKARTISSVDEFISSYALEDTPFHWSEDMLELVEEEKEVKNKEWLKKEIINRNLMRSARLFNLIDQLPDEREQLENAYEDMLKCQEFEFDGKEYVVMEKSETLSQEWIDEHEQQVLKDTNGWFVGVSDLENILAPELYSKEWHELIYKQLKDYSALTDKSFDFYWNAIANDIDIDDLMNVARENEVIVTKPEIPKFVADYVEWYVMNKKGWLNERRDIYHLVGVPTEYKEFDLVNPWAQKDGNTKKLIDAFYYGYTIKEEPKYYALIKGYDNPKLETTPWNDKVKWEHTTEGKLSVTLGTPLKYTAFTITEWNELGINDTNADFERVDSHDE